MRSRCAAAAAAFHLVALPAHAAAQPCWRPIDTSGADASLERAEYAELRRAVGAIEQLMLENPPLRDMPDTRGRIWRSSGGAPTEPRPHAAAVYAGRYWRPAWVAGPCGIHAQSERIPASHALRVSAWINDYEFILRTALSLRGRPSIFYQPQVLGSFGRFRFYGYANASGNAYHRETVRPSYSGFLLMTADGRLPWIPVSAGEYLDLMEERTLRYQQDLARQQPPAVTDEQIDRQVHATYESLRQVDAAAAEQFLVSMQKQLAKQRDPDSRMNRRMARGAASGERAEALRASQFAFARQQLGAALASQAYTGKGPAGFPADLATAADKGAIPLVKIDPSFWHRTDRGRVQIILFEFGGRASPEVIEDTLRSMELERAAALLR